MQTAMSRRVQVRPANGAADGPTGDIVYLTEGPEGALYYVRPGVADTTGTSA